MATMRQAGGAIRTTNALWTLIEPQGRDVKMRLVELINKSIAKSDAEEADMTKQEILSHIEQSCKEAQLIREGKLKAVTVEELINEL